MTILKKVSGTNNVLQKEWNMKRFCLLLIIAFSLISKMDAQQVEWAELIRGFDWESSAVIDTDNNGNILVAGYYSSDTLYFNNGIKLIKDWNDKSFIAKYSPEGKCLWAERIYNTTITSHLLASDNENNFCVSGCFFSPIIKFSNGLELKGEGNDDIFLAKFDTDGKLLWAKSMGSKYADNPTNLTVDNAGNVILAGEYRSDTLLIENEKYVKNGELGYFIAKYSKNGDLNYVKNFTSAVENDSSNSINIRAIKTDADNNMNVIMSFSNSIFIEDTITFENKNAVNKWLMVRYDENGKLLWARTFDFTKLVNHSGLGISDFDLDELGNFYFVGNISNGKILLDNGFEIDAGYNGASFITKHDRDGKCIWAETIAGTVGGFEFSYLKAHKNRCYVYGKIQEGKKFNSRNEEILGLDKRGLYIIQTDGLGSISKAYGIPVPKWIAPTSFCIDNNDKLIISGISGDFTDSISFGGDFNFDVSLNLEIFIAKFDMTTTSVTEYQNNNELVLFPNPACDFITIQFSNKELQLFASEDKVQIFDVFGIEVSQSSLIDNVQNNNGSVGKGLDLSTLRIDISHLPTGSYFIRIGYYSQKFMVVR